MEPRPRAGVSTYLEVFLLIGIAVGGSALVYQTTSRYVPVAQGPGVAINDASIRQGLKEAVERLVLANTGGGRFNSFTISTVGIQNAQFYVALTNLMTKDSIAPSLASGASGDTSITEAATVPPGVSILVSITIVSSSEFAVGQAYTVVVTTSGAAQASLQVLAVSF